MEAAPQSARRSTFQIASSGLVTSPRMPAPPHESGSPDPYVLGPTTWPDRINSAIGNKLCEDVDGSSVVVMPYAMYTADSQSLRGMSPPSAP